MDRAPIGVGDGIQLGVQAALGSADKTASLLAWPPFVAPPFPAIVEYLRRAIFLRRIAPAPAIATDEDYAAQNPPIIDARLAMALGKEGLKSRHLRVRQRKRLLMGQSPGGGWITLQTQD